MNGSCRSDPNKDSNSINFDFVQFIHSSKLYGIIRYLHFVGVHPYE